MRVVITNFKTLQVDFDRQGDYYQIMKDITYLYRYYGFRYYSLFDIDTFTRPLTARLEDINFQCRTILTPNNLRCEVVKVFRNWATDDQKIVMDRLFNDYNGIPKIYFYLCVYLIDVICTDRATYFIDPTDTEEIYTQTKAALEQALNPNPEEPDFIIEVSDVTIVEKLEQLRNPKKEPIKQEKPEEPGSLLEKVVLYTTYAILLAGMIIGIKWLQMS